jgi:hypothetical protein
MIEFLCVDCSCLDTAAEWMSSSVSQKTISGLDFLLRAYGQENDNSDGDSAMDAAKQTI